jgi:hypothetical protein
VSRGTVSLVHVIANCVSQSIHSTSVCQPFVVVTRFKYKTIVPSVIEWDCCSCCWMPGVSTSRAFIYITLIQLLYPLWQYGMWMLKWCCVSRFLRNSNGRFAFWHSVQKICSHMTPLEFKAACWAVRDVCCYKCVVVSGLSVRRISTLLRNILRSSSELKRLAHNSVIVKKFLAFCGTGKSITLFTITCQFSMS